MIRTVGKKTRLQLRAASATTGDMDGVFASEYRRAPEYTVTDILLKNAFH